MVVIILRSPAVAARRGGKKDGASRFAPATKDRMTAPTATSARAGLLYGLAAHGLWGVLPLYFVALGEMHPLELLAHRIVWCFVVLVGVVTATRGWPELWRRVRVRRTLGLLVASGFFIGANWYTFIYGFETHQVAECSLGYFVNPLFSVVLGLVLFRERLRPLQWLAVLVAAAGMAYLVHATGKVPWLALVVAVSFGLYGALRKAAPVDGLQGLTVETVVCLPPALGCVIYLSATGAGAFGTRGPAFDALLLGTGVVTAVPLFCFGQAARRLPLTTLGFLQYLAPSLQFLLAYFVLGERKAFTPERLGGFALIWLALAVFSVESLAAARRRAAAPAPEPPRRVTRPRSRRTSRR
jgi:chloramphenicol-sensitive protein RarD